MLCLGITPLCKALAWWDMALLSRSTWLQLLHKGQCRGICISAAPSETQPSKCTRSRSTDQDFSEQFKLYIAAKAFIFFFLAVIFSSFFNFPVCCAAGLKVNIRLSHCQNRNISALVSLKISCGEKRRMPSFKVE